MRGPEPVREEAAAVPEGPGRGIAVASALAVAAALAAAAAREPPTAAVVTRGDSRQPPDEGDPPAAFPPDAAVLVRVVARLRSEDPVERRETAAVVERLAQDLDPAGRLALAAALAALGGREAWLPLCLLAGDGDERVRVAARRALLALEQQDRSRVPAR